jgi:hypothetical protein
LALLGATFAAMRSFCLSLNISHFDPRALNAEQFELAKRGAGSAVVSRRLVT